MKNIILVLIIISNFTNKSWAQDKSKDDFREQMLLGVKVGMNFSNVYDSKTQNFNTNGKVGFAGGIYLGIPIGKLLGVQPEILFSQKGFHAKNNIVGSSYDFVRTTNFLDVPILFSIKPSKFVTLLIGPQYSYLLRQKDVYANGSTSSSQETQFENDNIRKNILCFVTGLDINYKHFSLSGRLGWDIQNNNGNGTSAAPRYKNVWYQYTLGYKI